MLVSGERSAEVTQTLSTIMSIENLTVKFTKKQHFAPTQFGSSSNGSDLGSGE